MLFSCILLILAQVIALRYPDHLGCSLSCRYYSGSLLDRDHRATEISAYRLHPGSYLLFDSWCCWTYHSRSYRYPSRSADRSQSSRWRYPHRIRRTACLLIRHVLGSNALVSTALIAFCLVTDRRPYYLGYTLVRASHFA